MSVISAIYATAWDRKNAKKTTTQLLHQLLHQTVLCTE